MLSCKEIEGVLTFRVRVVSRASHCGVAGEHDGALRVRVSAAPVDGAANEEVIRVLAKALLVPKGSVEITSGHTSKTKQVRVVGSTCSALDALVRA